MKDKKEELKKSINKLETELNCIELTEKKELELRGDKTVLLKSILLELLDEIRYLNNTGRGKDKKKLLTKRINDL